MLLFGRKPVHRPVCSWDTLNTNKRRNIHNTDKTLYNCGGYALDTYTWYMPFASEQQHMEFDEEYDEHVDEMVSAMITEFNGRLRIIDTIKDLVEGEEAVAFRACWRDFHFMRRKKNGRWYEKCGSSEYICPVKTEKVFSESWNHGPLSNNYNSKIVLLALKV